MMITSPTKRKKETVRPTRRKLQVRINPRTHPQLVVTLKEIL
jgi:hypothetical protein